MHDDLMVQGVGIEGRIVALRGQRVLLDSDLAQLYGVETRVLVQAVKRNAGRSRRTSSGGSRRTSGRL